MPITWRFEMKKVIDENDEMIFWDRQINAETIKEAVRKAEDIIKEKRISLRPLYSDKWGLNDENNYIFRDYYQLDSRVFRGSTVYHRSNFCAIVEPLGVSLLEISDYEKRMLWEGIC